MPKPRASALQIRKAPAKAGAFLIWRRHPDLNRGSRICSPMPYHLAMAPSSGDARYTSLSAAGQSPSAKSSVSAPASLLSNPKRCFVFVLGCGTSRYMNPFLAEQKNGAGDEARTRYLHLGKVALYRMSYARILHEAIQYQTSSPSATARIASDSVTNCLQMQSGASGRNRTNDTRIFSPLLYHLSYRGI